MIRVFYHNQDPAIIEYTDRGPCKIQFSSCDHVYSIYQSLSLLVNGSSNEELV